MQVNAFTSGFHGWKSTTGICDSRHIEWVYGLRDFGGVTVFEDAWMYHDETDSIKSGVRVGWLVEPRALRPENYARAMSVRGVFDYILTYDSELLAADPHKFVLAPRMGLHLAPHHWGMREKSRAVAMMSTTKLWTTGHAMRRAIAARHADVVDVYGATEWADKVASLAPYRFAVVVESERAPHLFTDHLLDVIALGCVPIYWGAPNIGQYLDAAGILSWEHLAELGGIASATPELYAEMLPAAERNFARLSEYQLAEDWLYERFFARFEGVRV